MRWFMANILVGSLTMMLVSVLTPSQDKLYCPVCQQRGYKSTIECRGGFTTDMMTHAWYDTNGVYHYDNPNYTIWDYECSRGHAWNSGGRISDSTDGAPWWEVDSAMTHADSLRTGFGASSSTMAGKPISGRTSRPIPSGTPVQR